MHCNILSLGQKKKTFFSPPSSFLSIHLFRDRAQNILFWKTCSAYPSSDILISFLHCSNGHWMGSSDLSLEFLQKVWKNYAKMLLCIPLLLLCLLLRLPLILLWLWSWLWLLYCQSTQRKPSKYYSGQQKPLHLLLLWQLSVVCTSSQLQMCFPKSLNCVNPVWWDYDWAR